MTWTAGRRYKKMHLLMGRVNKALSDGLALARYERSLDVALKRYKIRTDGALRIFKINGSRYEFEMARATAERAYEQDKAEASSELQLMKNASYAWFSVWLNKFKAEADKRKADQKKKARRFCEDVR